ncbi:MAG: TIM barrel protein [Mycobacterium sp.]
MTPTRIACTVRPWAQFSLERALDGIRTAGFDAVALPVHGVTAVVTPNTPVARVRDVGALIRDHGLDLLILSHAADLADDADVTLAELRRQIDHCVRLEVPTLVDMGCPELEHSEQYLRLMAAAAPYAAANGVTIAVKPHGGLTRTAADTLALVQRVGHHGFRACWDPGNLVHYGGQPPERGLAEIAPFIAAVGARDHPARGSGRARAEGMPPPITPGDGIVDFVALYRTLREHGFTGPSAVESVTKLGTVDGLVSEASRARRNLSDAIAGLVPKRAEPQRASTSLRSCSMVARDTKADPIGSAKPFDCYLMLELPLPWPPGMGTPVWETDRVPAPLRAALRTATRRIEGRGLTMKTFAAAPDPEYSTPGLMRIIRFDGATGTATDLTRVEHHVPVRHAAALVDALFGDGPSALLPWEQYRVAAHHRDLAVCTHASVDAYCGTYGYPFYRELRDANGGKDGVRVWRISSFGGHRFAPTLIDLPEARVWGNLTPERADHILHRTGTPDELLGQYRGWARLRSAGHQTLERELLLRYGWDWVGHGLAIESVTDVEHVLTIVDPHTGQSRTMTAELHDLGPEPVLVGCDRTAGEIGRYCARLGEPISLG